MDPITLILIALAVIILVIIGIVLYRTSHFAIQLPEDHLIPLEEIDGEEVARHIGLAIQMKTISHTAPKRSTPCPSKACATFCRCFIPRWKIT